MKDLYHMLNIDRDASAGEIAAALQLKPEMNVYSSILLDDGKRAEYDRTHAALKAVGMLRHNLGLDSGAPWFFDNYPDFTPRLRPAASFEGSKEVKSEQPPPAMVPGTAQDQGTTAASTEPGKWLVRVLVGIIIVSLLALIFTFL